jgi:hypothetical protein
MAVDALNLSQGGRMELDETIRQRLLTFQRIEITEHHIYQRLARVIRPPENQQVLEQIAQDELRHYQDWKRYTGQEVRPDQLKIWFYYWVSRIFGFTFGVKLMERGEELWADHGSHPRSGGLSARGRNPRRKTTRHVGRGAPSLRRIGRPGFE